MRRLALIIVVVLAAAVTSLYVQASLPAPTGPSAVGRSTAIFQDGSRPEIATDAAGDTRQIRVEFWYPAAADSGSPTKYFPMSAALRNGLRDSGELTWLEMAALPLVRSRDRLDGDMAAEAGSLPLVLFSPGNGTNAEFYSGIADELASRGYIVASVNHPYDVAAVAVGDGLIAVFEPGPFDLRQDYVASRVDERAADISFLLDELTRLARSGDQIAAAIDFDRVVAMGHSLGGLAAAQACAEDARIAACVNLDGIQAGGVFAARPSGASPPQPFLFLTKETQLGPLVSGQLEARTIPAYVVMLDNATHDSFTDGPALMPAILPVGGRAEQNLATIRGAIVAFLDAALSDRAPSFAGLDEVQVLVYGATP